MQERDQVRKHILVQMRQLRNDNVALREFLGQAICDGGCPDFNDECIRLCPIAVALDQYESDPNDTTWNMLESCVNVVANKIYKRR